MDTALRAITRKRPTLQTRQSVCTAKPPREEGSVARKAEGTPESLAGSVGWLGWFPFLVSLSLTWQDR
jgi:hypothetical protein